MTVTISGRTGDPKALSSLIAWSRELYPSYSRPKTTSPTVQTDSHDPCEQQNSLGHTAAPPP